MPVSKAYNRSSVRADAETLQRQSVDAANTNSPSSTGEDSLLDWLLKFIAPNRASLSVSLPVQEKTLPAQTAQDKTVREQPGGQLLPAVAPYTAEDSTAPNNSINNDNDADWSAVEILSCLSRKDIRAAGGELPLTAAEVNYFFREHRGVDYALGRDFLTSAQKDAPSPLAELYALYRYRARRDSLSSFVLAQATGQTRVADTIGNLLALGAFFGALECIHYEGANFSVPAALDTATVIDISNAESIRRLALPPDHPSHLIGASLDELSTLAVNLSDRHTLSLEDFLRKARLLAEARQDVRRLDLSKSLKTAICEGDLPDTDSWVERLKTSARIVVPDWAVG